MNFNTSFATKFNRHTNFVAHRMNAPQRELEQMQRALGGGSSSATGPRGISDAELAQASGRSQGQHAESLELSSAAQEHLNG